MGKERRERKKWEPKARAHVCASENEHESAAEGRVGGTCVVGAHMTETQKKTNIN